MTAPRAKHINDMIASRRALLGGLAGMPLLNLASCATARPVSAAPQPPAFASVAATNADTVSVPPGYRTHTLIGWGDALFEGMAPFDPDALTRAEQEKRWGQNNDMLSLFPIEHAFPPPRADLRDGDRLILCANNEYSEPALMFPSLPGADALTSAHAATAIAGTGVSIVVIERSNGAWRVVRDAAPGSGLNRRITPYTPVVFSGPATRHPWISAAGAIVNAAEPGLPHEPNPAGAIRCGTTANCAGGETPWGTYLTSEENFDYLFKLTDERAPAFAAAQSDPAYQFDLESFGAPARQMYNRLFASHNDLSTNPYCTSLYGWVVEIDPYDPSWAPRKRTALGRKKGEAATTALTRDGRVATYMGDDQVNEFVYKFVSRDRFNPNDRLANRDLLDHGTLYVAKFEEDGTGVWLPISAAAANAAAPAGSTAPFRDDADAMVRSREAARLMGATPMDRPEDVEAVRDANWLGLGPVLIACTKNTQQAPARPGNPRRESADGNAAQANAGGHVLRLDEAGGDVGATRFTWDVFLMGGDPNATELTAASRSGRLTHVSTNYNGAPTIAGERFACPDNLFIDSRFNVWITTDGSDDVFPDCNDQVMVAPTSADGPRPIKRFLVGPLGSEICGPVMTQDERAFMCAIQHPGESDVAGQHITQLRWREGQRPPSHWPDGGESWPRSAVVIVTREDGGKIGD